MKKSPYSRLTVLSLLATLLLRAAIPDGYMPAATGSGLLFELCPSGMPAELMQALAGSNQHHQHGSEQDSAAYFDAAQCPIGHMLSAVVAADDHWQIEVPPFPPAFAAAEIRTPASAAQVARRSRGPPA